MVRDHELGSNNPFLRGALTDLISATTYQTYTTIAEFHPDQYLASNLLVTSGWAELFLTYHPIAIKFDLMWCGDKYVLTERPDEK